MAIRVSELSGAATSTSETAVNADEAPQTSSVHRAATAQDVDRRQAVVAPLAVPHQQALLRGLARGRASLRTAGVRSVSLHGARYAPGDVYFLGDSQTEGLRLWGGLREPEGTGRDGESHAQLDDHRGKTTKFFLQRLRRGELDGALADERLVVLNCGGNDITGSNWNADRIIANFRDIVRELRRINPQVHVVISEIPVRGRWMDAHPRHKETREPVLDAVNAWLRAGGDSDPSGVRFESFPTNHHIAELDALGRPTRYQRRAYRRANPDVHLNAEGYRQLGAALRQRFFAN